MATQVNVVAPTTRVPRRAINELAQQIAHRFNPERIYLFGPYACGQPRSDSKIVDNSLDRITKQ